MHPQMSLFEDLQPLGVPTVEKPDPHENLTDILEIVAVAAGLKPAHLQGQGQHDEERLALIERLATRHGLKTLRTKGLVPHFGRAPGYEELILKWQVADYLKQQQQGPDVVWVYVDERLEGVISDAVAGRTDVAVSLGYPQCCVTHSSEQKLIVGEAYIEGIKNTFHPATPEDTLTLYQGDVQVQVALDPDADIVQTGASLKRFPYLQLIACSGCLVDANSAAAQSNRAMRDLAFELSPGYGREIWKARDLVVTRGRPQGYGRNDPCPCGSGAKFKRCCLG